MLTPVENEIRQATTVVQSQASEPRETQRAPLAESPGTPNTDTRELCVSAMNTWTGLARGQLADVVLQCDYWRRPIDLTGVPQSDHLTLKRFGGTKSQRDGDPR